VLSAGRIVATGAPVQVLTEPLIAAVYGVRCRVSIEDGLPHVRFAHR